MINNFWEKLNERLSSFVDSLSLKQKGYQFYIGRSENENFPLRGYLSITKSKDSDELSIVVDVKSKADRVLIESGIYLEDGVIVDEGPKLTSCVLNFEDIDVQEIEMWFKEFDNFLIKNFSKVKEEVELLT